MAFTYVDLDSATKIVQNFQKSLLPQGNAIEEVNRRFNAELQRQVNDPLKWGDKEKGLAWLSSASQPVQQEIVRQDLVSAPKIVKNFQKSDFTSR